MLDDPALEARYLLGGLSLKKAELVLEASLLSESLAEFVKAAWHVLEPTQPLRWGWAMDAMCEHLEAVTRGQINRLLMNVPPGMSKSLLTGVFWPAWEWTRKELRAHRYLSTAHKQDLAVRDNLKCRRLITSRWYQERWPIVLTGDQNAKTKFENEDTGFREAMAFTSMTGSRGSRVILDDPLSADDANSEAALLAVERTFTEALPTRVNDDRSAIVVIMQRLHEKDPSGLILERDLGYVHLCLPMRFESDRRCVTSIGFRDPRKKDGELLFPERFTPAQVDALEKTMGSFAVAGQFQQRPIPRGGGMFKTEHLRLWPADKRIPVFEYLLQSYDTAYTDNTANDPTACTVWGVFKHEGKYRVMLVDGWDEHLNYAALRKRVILDWKTTYGAEEKKLDRPGRRPDACLVEIKGSGISLIQELRQANVPAQAYNPGRADKFGRASQVLPLYELGIVYVPESQKNPTQPVSWAKPFADQLARFGPGVSAHDDYVDTFTQALIYLRDSGWLDLPYAEEDEITELPYGKQKRNPYD
jgi:predicted phage terminase large subunit-like protein